MVNCVACGHFTTNEFSCKECQRTNIKLIQGNCLEEMKAIPDHSIHLVLTDLPYGTTQNKWDEVIPFQPMWEELDRILVDGGIMLFTATQPFTSQLVMSNTKQFKYELIWEKTIGSGQLNIKKQPLRVHESILVFYAKPGTYNEKKTKGEPYTIDRTVKSKGEGYGVQTDSSKVNDGFRHAKSIIKVSNPRIKGGHPTQKPIELMSQLIKTYSNPGDVVLDYCMGSGTTGEAAIKLGRKFIGIELDRTYFEQAKERIIRSIE